MRTTINISEQVYRAAKALAATTSQTVSKVIEDAVREALRPKQLDQQEVGVLPVFGGSGVLPGVDLTNRASLLDEMDVEEPVHALR